MPYFYKITIYLYNILCCFYNFTKKKKKKKKKGD